MKTSKASPKSHKRVRPVNKPAGSACEDCPLRDRPCVPSETSRKARIAIVGEAPGSTELQEGRPFIGPSGRLLQKLLGEYGYDRQDVIWTNAALCQVKESKELTKASKQCRERLHRELKGILHVVPVGAYALQSVLRLKKKPSILKSRGFVFRDRERTVLPTVHPAFVLRAPLWHSVIGLDFERVSRISKTGWLPPEKLYDRKRLLIKTVKALDRELRTLESIISLDVETTEEPATQNKLICFSMTDVSGEKTIVVPWSVDMAGNGRYFSDRQEEAADLVNAALRFRTAVTHNGPSFDHIVLARHGIYVQEWDDTLIAHHAFASHMPQRLSHVVSVYVDAPPWKDQREDTLKDLYRYNSQDTLYTSLAWKEMQDDLNKERKIYELDCVSSDLCRDMQENGFRFDVARAAHLQKYLKKKCAEATERAEAVIGQSINLKSPKQLRRAFFDILDAPVYFKSVKTRQAALHVDALRAYAAFADDELRELATAVLDFRKAQKVQGTYIDPPLVGRILLDEEDRIHPSWRSFGAVSGRFSCRDPNLMNLPRAANDPSLVIDEADKSGKTVIDNLSGIRSLYIASPGHVIINFDCLTPSMRVLRTDLTWCRAGNVEVGDELVGFDEVLGKSAKMRRTKVQSVGRIRRKCYRVWTDRGMVEASADHTWVVRPARGDRASLRRWVATKDLQPGDRMSFFAQPWETDRTFEGGYLAGFFDGEGYVSARTNLRGGTVGFGQALGDTYNSVLGMLARKGFEVGVRVSKKGTGKAGSVRRKDLAQCWIKRGDSLRFLGSIRPSRLIDKAGTLWEGAKTWSGSPRSRPATVLRIEDIGVQEVIAVGTSTNTFIAEGFLSHNCKQLEMRIAAYVSGDKVMIAACETDDLHAANAALLFGNDFINGNAARKKELRDLAKTSGFAIAYMAQAPTVYARLIANGQKITIGGVEALLKTMRKKFVTYYAWQDDLLHKTIRLAYVESPIVKRKRWLGHSPKPTECANFPIQSGAADHMNLLLPKLMEELPSYARLIAQIHDAAMFEVPERKADDVAAIIKEIAEMPVMVCGKNVVFPIDLKIGGRWSEV